MCSWRGAHPRSPCHIGLLHSSPDACLQVSFHLAWCLITWWAVTECACCAPVPACSTSHSWAGMCRPHSWACLYASQAQPCARTASSIPMKWSAPCPFTSDTLTRSGVHDITKIYCVPNKMCTCAMLLSRTFLQAELNNLVGFRTTFCSWHSKTIRHDSFFFLKCHCSDTAPAAWNASACGCSLIVGTKFNISNVQFIIESAFHMNNALNS